MATTRVFRSGERVVLIRESGIPDGPDYVLAHGLGMAHEYWDAMAEVIEPTGTVFALDLPGLGGAPEPPRPLSMAESDELLADHRIERVLPSIEAETLVVRGEHDHLVPRYWAPSRCSTASRC